MKQQYRNYYRRKGGGCALLAGGTYDSPAEAYTAGMDNESVYLTYVGHVEEQAIA